MQGYIYSIFSLSAILIHLMINFRLLAGHGAIVAHGSRYRGYLFGILAYYMSCLNKI